MSAYCSPSRTQVATIAGAMTWKRPKEDGTGAHPMKNPPCSSGSRSRRSKEDETTVAREWPGERESRGSAAKTRAETLQENPARWATTAWELP